jgi:hypothetical protein
MQEIISQKRNVGNESFYSKLDVFNKGKIYVITGREKKSK